MIASPIIKPNFLSTSSSASSSSAFLSSDINQVPFSAIGFRSFSRSASSLQLTCAATKQVKSPADEDWKTKREVLLQKRVRSVDVEEAFRLQKENNFVILDVRPEAEYKEGHPPGAINVQICRLIKEWTAWDIARCAAFAFFGIFSGTEENPEFIQTVESKLDKEAKIIVACSTGGSMKPSQNLPEGNQSRHYGDVELVNIQKPKEGKPPQYAYVSFYRLATLLRVLNGTEKVKFITKGKHLWARRFIPKRSHYGEDIYTLLSHGVRDEELGTQAKDL